MKAALSGKLVIPEWAGPTGSTGSPGVNSESSPPHRTTSAPTGPYGYQPEYFNKQGPIVKHQKSASVSRRNSSAALLLTAAGGGSDGEGAGLVSRAGFPISRQSSSSMLLPGSKQPPVLNSGRTRRPSLLGLPPIHAGLHALPEHDAYLGQPKASTPRRTSSFLTSSGSITRKHSLDHEAANHVSMPLVNLKAQSDVMDASLLEPEILDRDTSVPLNISRRSTSGSCEVPSGSSGLQGALPPVPVSCNTQHDVCLSSPAFNARSHLFRFTVRSF